MDELSLPKLTLLIFLCSSLGLTIGLGIIFLLMKLKELIGDSFYSKVVVISIILLIISFIIAFLIKMPGDEQ